jgi:hypothetical protein
VRGRGEDPPAGPSRTSQGCVGSLLGYDLVSLGANEKKMRSRVSLSGRALFPLNEPLFHRMALKEESTADGAGVAWGRAPSLLMLACGLGFAFLWPLL